MNILKSFYKLPLLFLLSIICLIGLGCVGQSSLISCNPFTTQPFSDAVGLPYKAFVNLNSSRRFRPQCEENDKQPDGKCPIAEEGYSASGSVIFRSKADPNVGYILTARHFCDHSNLKAEGEDLGHRFTATDYYGREHNVIPYFSSKLVDACIMVMDGMDDYLQTIDVSPEEPVQGERVYNLAAPHNLFDAGVVLTFEGIYSGTRSDTMAIYTIPAAPGSSGSPIMRADGTLVGMIWSVPMRRSYMGSFVIEQRLMESIAIAVPYRAIRDIISSVESMDDVFGVSLTPKTGTTTTASISKD